jgi:hypothetical protein
MLPRRSSGVSAPSRASMMAAQGACAGAVLVLNQPHSVVARPPASGATSAAGLLALLALLALLLALLGLALVRGALPSPAAVVALAPPAHQAACMRASEAAAPDARLLVRRSSGTPPAPE